MTGLRIGMIGAGKFAQTLAQVAAAEPGLRITAAYDPIIERAEMLARDHNARAYAALTDLWPNVDAVMIASSHDTHCPNTSAAAQAGKHIFCEKPMAIDVVECRAMIDAANRNGVKLMIGQVTRLMPMMVRLRQILVSGLIGRPVAIHIMRAAWSERQGWWSSKTASGGVLHSHGAHMYDLLNSLLGQATTIYAVAAPRIQPQVDFDDTIFSAVTYDSGAICTVNASISGQTWVYVGNIIAGQGSLQFGLDLAQCWITYQPRGGELIRETFGTFDQESVDGVAAEIHNFADFVLRDASPFVTNVEAMQAVAMLQAAYESVRTGGVVHLPVPQETGAR